jgi:hypothetical protein
MPVSPCFATTSSALTCLKPAAAVGLPGAACALMTPAAPAPPVWRAASTSAVGSGTQAQPRAASGTSCSSSSSSSSSSSTEQSQHMSESHRQSTSAVKRNERRQRWQQQHSAEHRRRACIGQPGKCCLTGEVDTQKTAHHPEAVTTEG